MIVDLEEFLATGKRGFASRKENRQRGLSFREEQCQPCLRKRRQSTVDKFLAIAAGEEEDEFVDENDWIQCEVGTCGRRAKPGFSTCCKSCPYLDKKFRRPGHDCECDIRNNGGHATPFYWHVDNDCAEDDFHDELEDEYDRGLVEKLLRKTIGTWGEGCEIAGEILEDTVKVARCVRVQNAKLWREFTAKRAEVRARGNSRLRGPEPTVLELLEYSARSTLDSSVNEAWLFHGTSEEAAFSIAKNDFRLPEHAGYFGKGLYFAESALKSDGYAEPNYDGESVILLCRVILGRQLGPPVGPMMHAASIVQDYYDSLLGKVDDEGAREFVVYDKAYVYPEYIMFYTYERDGEEPPEPDWEPEDESDDWDSDESS